MSTVAARFLYKTIPVAKEAIVVMLTVQPVPVPPVVGFPVPVV
jgi:hypothetical protein